jgi:hypothetical protein
LKEFVNIATRMVGWKGSVTIARKGRGEFDAQRSKEEKKDEGESLKSRKERSREEVKGENDWCCKHDEPYRLVNVEVHACIEISEKENGPCEDHEHGGNKKTWHE